MIVLFIGNVLYILISSLVMFVFHMDIEDLILIESN